MFSDSAISDYLTTIPEVPGVYQFFNSEGIIIYIGKARNLKKRVSSYFYKSHENAKLKILVSKIHKIEYIIVNNESDSLLLENNLIKQYKPKYNVLLKDDKTYPWLCIKKEPFPRVMTTRNYIEDGSQYFGPYASGKLLFTLRELIFKLFPIRTCSFNLTEENIRKEKFKVCLEFHIGNCLGPCIAKQNKDDYDTNIRFIREILKGNLSSVISFLRQGMQEDASNLEYEKAQQKKKKLK